MSKISSCSCICFVLHVCFPLLPPKLRPYWSGCKNTLGITLHFSKKLNFFQLWKLWLFFLLEAPHHVTSSHRTMCKICAGSWRKKRAIVKVTINTSCFVSSLCGDVFIFHMDKLQVSTAHSKSRIGYNGRQDFPPSEESWNGYFWRTESNVMTGHELGYLFYC